MAAAAVGTLVVTIFLVAGAAIWLIMVAVALQQITFQLDVVLKSVTGIAGQVTAVPGVVTSIARDVGAIQSALHGLVALASGAAAASGPGRAPAPAPVAPTPAPEPVSSGRPTRSGGRRY
jgi:hypothetical protein